MTGLLGQAVELPTREGQMVAMAPRCFCGQEVVVMKAQWDTGHGRRPYFACGAQVLIPDQLCSREFGFLDQSFFRALSKLVDSQARVFPDSQREEAAESPPHRGGRTRASSRRREG